MSYVWLILTFVYSDGTTHQDYHLSPSMESCQQTSANMKYIKANLITTCKEIK